MELSRRRFLQIAGLGLGALVLSEVPQAQLISPSESFRNYPEFHTRLSYTKEEFQSNNIICFGDSNMVGANGISPVDILTEKTGWNNWNFAVIGADTTGMRQQIKDAQLLMNDLSSFDIFINVGGDNLLDLAGTPESSRRIASLAEHPFNLEAWNVSGRLVDTINNFGNDFSKILLDLSEKYGEKIKHFIIITPPNFSETNSISVLLPNGSNCSYPINTPFLKAYAYSASVLLTNQTCESIDTLAQHTSIPVEAVYTWDFGKNDFQGDEHFNERGKEKIVQRIMNSIQIVDKKTGI